MTTANGRGLMGRCPACGKSHLFNSFLRVVAECTNCGAPLGLVRADDVPPYITILITGHIIVPLLIFLETRGTLSYGAEAALLLSVTIVSTLLLLPLCKGFFLAAVWSLSRRAG